MAATRHPLIDLIYNDETGRYIGMLERKIIKYQIDDLKFRTLLELLTGDSWDDYRFSDEDGEIRNLAQDALKRRLGISHEDAAKLVAERWVAHNPPEPDESTKTYLIGQPTKTQHVVSHARSMERPQPYDVRKHLSGIEQARANRAGRLLTEPSQDRDLQRDQL